MLSRAGIVWAVALLLPLGLWLASAPFVGLPLTVFGLRDAFVQGSGLATIGLIVAAMVLAARPMVLERALGGLDRVYRLHRALGIGVLAFGTLHWLGVQGPKWAVQLGWLERPPRGARAPAESTLQQVLHALRGSAESTGEVAFYVLAVLVLLALVTRFPYRHFYRLHRLLPLVVLALALHAVVLVDDRVRELAIGTWLYAALAVAAVAALRILFRAVGRDRRAIARVDSVQHHVALQVLEVAVRLKGRWQGHEAGQFAFVRFGGGRTHPFTLASAWAGDGRIVFLVKGLGEDTKALPKHLKAGDLLTIEGPYGQFQFAGEKPQQIWIGAGIGITPFIARLRQLALRPDGRRIEFFHTTREADAGAFQRLRDAAAAAQVQLHILVDSVDGRLDAERLCRAVPGWRDSDVWFCGPAAFGKRLRRDLLGLGLPPRDFHQELFNLR